MSACDRVATRAEVELYRKAPALGAATRVWVDQRAAVLARRGPFFILRCMVMHALPHCVARAYSRRRNTKPLQSFG